MKNLLLAFLLVPIISVAQTAGDVRNSYYNNGLWNTGTWTGSSGVLMKSGSIPNVHVPISTRVEFGGTGGTLANDADFTYDTATDTLTIRTLSGTTSMTIQVGGVTRLFINSGTYQFTPPTNVDAVFSMGGTGLVKSGTRPFLMSTLITNAPDIANSVWASSNALMFEGATADGNEGTLAITDVTSDRTWTMPDYTGDVQVANSNATSLDQTLIAASLPYQSYTGTGGTWTLPLLSSNRRAAFFIKNRGSGNLSLTRQGADQLYDTAAVNSITVAPGEARIIVPDPAYWLVE